MSRRVAVRGVVTHQGKVLSARLNLYKSDQTITTKYQCIPGGGVDDGESLLTALEREMIEETGVSPTIGKLLYVQQFMHEDREHLEFFFHITNGSEYTNIDLTKTSHGEKEIAEIHFTDPANSELLPEFLRTESFDETSLASAFTKVFDYIP